MSNPTLSIVIPGIDQVDYTLRCFNSIRVHAALPYELVWVDNHSQPRNHAKIREFLDKHKIAYRIIKNPENYGFIKASNQGIRTALGKYIVLLNNDTEVTAGWDVQLTKPFTHMANVGAVGPITQRSAWQTPHQVNVMYKTNLPRISEPMSTFLKNLNEFRNKYIDVTPQALSFFCTVFSKEVMDKVGLLCEEMSVGLGDDDEYCMRLRSHGYRTVLSLGTFVHHVHRATFNALHLGMESLRMHNMKILRRKKKELKKAQATSIISS